MIRLPLLAFAVLVGAPPQAALRSQEDDVARLRADVEFLAGPECDGRAAGTPGGARAARYVAERMRSIGLRPLPGSGCYLQRFVAPDPRPRDYVRRATGLAVHDGEAFEDLALERDVLPFRGSADGEVEAEVVFAGYGLRAPEQGLDDYRGLDVAGKVVLVLRGAPRSAEVRRALRKRRAAVLFRSKMAAAREAGAIGFLLCDAVQKGSRGGEDLRVALRARGEAGIPAMWISRAAARRLVARSGVEFDELQRRADRGEASGVLLEGARVRMRVRMGEPRPGLATANVVGWLPGRSGELARQYVVVGAHYDHLGRGFFGSLGGPPARGRLHPGADDNASGVAGLLAVAERLTRGPELPRSVVFVAFGAEEVGMAGSRHFLEECPFARERIVAMVALTMIGRAGTAGLSIQGVGSGRGMRGLVAELVAARGDLRVWLRDTTSLRSDHYVFLRSRIPALLFHTGLHDQFHTPADVPSLVQTGPAVRVAELAAAVVGALAAAEPAPEFAWPANGRRRK